MGNSLNLVDTEVSIGKVSLIVFRSHQGMCKSLCSRDKLVWQTFRALVVSDTDNMESSLHPEVADWTS